MSVERALATRPETELYFALVPWFGEPDEPRSKGQLRVVWLAHEHEP